MLSVGYSCGGCLCSYIKNKMVQSELINNIKLPTIRISKVGFRCVKRLRGSYVLTPTNDVTTAMKSDLKQ